MLICNVDLGVSGEEGKGAGSGCGAGPALPAFLVAGALRGC